MHRGSTRRQGGRSDALFGHLEAAFRSSPLTMRRDIWWEEVGSRGEAQTPLAGSPILMIRSGHADQKIIIENVRSFLDRREMSFDGPISIIIGPNGGGKTNLLDVVNTMLRRYLFATRYFTQTHDAEQQVQWELRHNDHLNQMRLEKHSSGRSLPQFVAIEIEVSQNDLDNMRLIQNDAEELRTASKRRFVHNPWDGVAAWQIDDIRAGQRLMYVWQDGAFQAPATQQASHFLQYLQMFELDNDVRAEIGKDALKLSMVYLPVNRSASGFQGSIGLAG